MNEESNNEIPDEDADLVAGCKAELPAETSSYYELLSKYEGMIYSTCLRMLGDSQEAEEACQDAFLRVFHKVHQFEGRSTFKTWLFRIACNICMTRRKKLAMKRERDQLVGADIVQSSEPQPPAAKSGEEAQAETVHDTLQKLSEEEREIISLRFVSDLSLAEMSDVLGIKLSATKMRLYRAMERFKSIYAEGDIAKLQPGGH
ncbi:sigma-70 family RNA polymerase sigma factor [Verrucomicrobiales bacterium BCK34]|nr:sigma-70 family RNA polymerase sigma factor [Verrucomicrobiales bacterium BCK34]